MTDTSTEVEEATGPRSQIWKHEAMVEWLTGEKGMPEDADAATVIAYAFAYRVEWRRTETYSGLVAEHAETAEAERAERTAAREQAAAERKAEREAAAAAKAEAKAAEAAKAEAAPAKATKATKETAKAAPAKATKSTKKGASTEENPFE